MYLFFCKGWLKVGESGPIPQDTYLGKTIECVWYLMTLYLRQPSGSFLCWKGEKLWPSRESFGHQRTSLWQLWHDIGTSAREEEDHFQGGQGPQESNPATLNKVDGCVHRVFRHVNRGKEQVCQSMKGSCGRAMEHGECGHFPGRSTSPRI